MAKKKTTQDTRNWSVDFADGGKQVVDLSSEIKNSMQEYIDYTLTNRALPYIDGLKPVHKAILWSMWQSGYKSNGLSHKSATISGEVIGKYWAHSGDAAYLASAGMTRAKADDTRCGACKLNLSLINGHGNFGASFEDGPASQRYTEQKLSENGESCVRGAENGAVFMEPTFDAKHTLPELAPVEIPLLLINGSDGLAYGYNVSWLPHNPSEAIKSVIKRIDKPNCTINDILRIMPGPDFPSGGIIIDDDDKIKSAYKTGMGTITLTSRYFITELSRGRHAIDFYETPFGVSRSGDKSIVSGITAFALDNPACGITSVKNLSGGDNDCLIEVTLKSGINAQMVADMLINNTSCMLTQSVSYRQSAVIGDFERTDAPDATKRTGMLRLCHQKPRDLGMLEYIDAFIDFRRSCVINSCEYERGKVAARKHLIDGLIAALIDIDEVIKTIRHSNNKDTARTNLKRRFKLDDAQADYILGIPLSRLTRSDRIQLEGNSKDMANRIKELDNILSSDDNVIAEVRRRLVEVLKMQKLPRRTTIVSSNGSSVKAKADDEERLKQAVRSADVILGKQDMKRISSDNDDSSLGKGNGDNDMVVDEQLDVFLCADGKVAAIKHGSRKKKPDYVYVSGPVSSRDSVMLVFSDGDSLRLPAYELPQSSSIVSKRCSGIIPYSSDDALKQAHIAMTTSDGKCKVLDCSTLTKNPSCSVMNVSTGAELTCARAVSKNQSFVFITSAASLLRFPVSSVNAQGRTSAGVAGVKLPNGASVVYAGVCDDSSKCVTFTGSTLKVSSLSEFPAKGRGTLGVRCHKMLKGESRLTGAYVGLNPEADGVDLPEASKRDASGTKIDNSLDALTVHERA